MKTFRFISTFAMLALATVVTAGSMYVTVRAAAQQDGAEIGAAAPETAPDVPELAGDVQVPDVQAALDQLDAALDKSKILRDRQNHVILDENGVFRGRLSSFTNSDGEMAPVANLPITVVQHGQEVGSTTTDAEGRFSLSGLPEGVVAIGAEGENALMLFSCVLFKHDTKVEENSALVAAHSELAIDSLVSSGSDLVAVRELIAPYLNVEEKRFTSEVAVDDQNFAFGQGQSSTTLRGHRVRLQADGTLQGEINVLDERTGRVREVLDMTVHFVRNGVRIASSEVANDGSFIASGLNPGIHSVVAVGQDGILVTAVDVVGSSYEDAAANGNGEFKPVSLVAESLSFSGSPVRPRNFKPFSNPPGGGSGSTPGGITGMNPASPSGGGGYSGGGGSGFSGGSGGGGGGIGGGGGLGALLAGGIGGAIGYLAGQNNNPASPGL